MKRNPSSKRGRSGAADRRARMLQAAHLYVHVPFCVHKCPYCDFNSHVRADPPWEDYTEALVRELTFWSEQAPFAGRKLSTVFFGGGTPSLAPASLIERVLETAECLFGLTNEAEITMEANPGASDAAGFAACRKAGVNRLSLGVQSFSDAELAWLERIHDARAAREAFDTARKAGFDNINLDLIYALPGQSLATWLAQLERAIALAPEHLSCYQLTIEPHTLLAARHRKHPLPLPDDETALDFLHRTRQRLSEAGFHAYEISNHARPGRECRHNDGYWRYHDYIGIGAGAAGKWDESSGGITRYANLRSPEGYIGAVRQHRQAVHGRESLDAFTAMAEALWLGLRRTNGMSRTEFTARFGIDPVVRFQAALAPWRERGCLHVTEASLKLTPSGLGLADAIAADLFQTDDGALTSEAESNSS